MVYLMRKLNVHTNRLMNLVYQMTILQGFYDFVLTGFCGNDDKSEKFHECRTSVIGIGIFAGVASSACTNIISGMLAYVIYTKETTSVSKPALFLFVYVPSIILGILSGIYYAQGTVYHDESAFQQFKYILSIYDWYRMAQVIFNFICGSVIFYKLYEMNVIFTSGPKQAKSSEGVAEKGKSYPMFLLAMRLVWYPVVQGVSRWGATWYQMVNGTTITSYVSDAQKSKNPNLLTLQLYNYVILVPFAGLGYFLIFVYMQRGAWTLLKATCRDILCIPEAAEADNTDSNTGNIDNADREKSLSASTTSIAERQSDRTVSRSTKDVNENGNGNGVSTSSSSRFTSTTVDSQNQIHSNSNRRTSGFPEKTNNNIRGIEEFVDHYEDRESYSYPGNSDYDDDDDDDDGMENGRASAVSHPRSRSSLAHLSSDDIIDDMIENEKEPVSPNQSQVAMNNSISGRISRRESFRNSQAFRRSSARVASVKDLAKSVRMQGFEGFEESVRDLDEDELMELIVTQVS